MITLGDVLTEFTERPASGIKLPILTLTEKNGFVLQSDRFKKRLATDDTSAYKVVHRDDIAFNPYLLWAGAIARNVIADAGIISPLYPTFRVLPGFDSGYIARLLLTVQMVAKFDTIAFGSVPRRRRSSVRDFLGLPLPKQPPLPEQRRIAAILDQADAVRAKRRETLAHLDALPQAHLRHRSNLWTAVRACLGDLASVTSGITKGRRTTQPTTEVPYLAVANVQAGRLDLSDVKTIAATRQEIEKYALQQDDLVLTEGGDPDKLGRGTVWRNELPLSLHQNHIFRVRIPRDRVVHPEYLSAYLGSPAAKEYFLRSAKQTTGIASINMSQLRGLPVPVPKWEEQLTLVQDLQRVTQLTDAVSSALAQDDELFASLQHRAFRGEL